MLLFVIFVLATRSIDAVGPFGLQIVSILTSSRLLVVCWLLLQDGEKNQSWIQLIKNNCLVQVSFSIRSFTLMFLDKIVKSSLRITLILILKISLLRVASMVTMPYRSGGWADTSFPLCAIHSRSSCKEPGVWEWSNFRGSWLGKFHG